MQIKPLVSILMTVYNGERFLADAIQSILSQTLDDFELIVVNDGSTDGSGKILEEFCRKDRRIRVLTQSNQGVSAAANNGLAQVRGCYLARLDSDDLAMPQRLEKQVDYLRKNLEAVVVGSAYQSIDEGGKFLRLDRPPEHDTAIRWANLFDNPFAHSSILIRIDTLCDHQLRYPIDVGLAEDYAFLSQLLDYGRGHNLPDILLKRRFHGKQISEDSLKAPLLRNIAVKVAQANMRKLGFELPQDQVQTLVHWSHHFPRILDTTDQSLCVVLLAILKKFCMQPGLDLNQVHLVRGRVLLRMLMARSDEPVGWLWKFHLLRRLSASDLAWVIQYAWFRGTLSRKTP